MASQPTEPEAHLDLLPPELILFIVDFLNSADKLALIAAYPRIKGILSESPKALLKLKQQTAFIQEVRLTRFNFVVRKTCLFLSFLKPTLQSTVHHLVELAARIPTGRALGGNCYLVLVLARSAHEAHELHAALLDNNFNAEMTLDYVSRETWSRFRSYKSKFFLVVRKIGEHFEMNTMAGIISYRQPQDEHDVLEVHSLNPRRVYQAFEPTPKGLEVLRDVIRLLAPYARHFPSIQLDPPLRIDRDFYKARFRSGSGVVAKVFAD